MAAIRKGTDLAAHLWWGWGSALVLVVLGVPLAAMVRGPGGAAGFAMGAGLVVASHTVSSLVFAWAQSVAGALVLPLGLATYITKFAVLISLLVALEQTNWAGRGPLGIGLMLTAIAWSSAQIVWAVTTRPSHQEVSTAIPACQPRKA